MNNSEKLKILIIHPLNVIADLIRFKLESDFNCDTEIEVDLKTRRKSVCQSNFSVVISALDVSGENALEFFDELVDSGTIPIFFIIENKKMKANHFYKNKSPVGILPETNLLRTLSDYLNTLLSKSKDAPEEWTKISLLPLSHFSGLPVNVFIQLSTGRFLKIFNRGDKITSKDTSRYMDKGVTNLYLEKKSFHWLINQIDEALPTIIKNPNIAITLPEIEDLSSFDEEYPKLVKPFVMEHDLLEEFHQSSKKVLNQIKKNQELVKLLKAMNLDRTPNAYIRNRIDLVCNISCALARELTWSSDSMFEKLIYVSYTHDLTLMNNPKLARIQTIEELELVPDISNEDKKIFLNHPKAVAEIVLRDIRAPAEAEMIIRQHHELASSKGFPDGLQSVRILPTAALIEISIHFAQYIIENPNWKFEKYAIYASPHFRGGPFTKIFKALENLLKKRT